MRYATGFITAVIVGVISGITGVEYGIVEFSLTAALAALYFEVRVGK